MANTINSLSPNFRDFLLQRNIITDTINDNGLAPLLRGVGLPTNVGHVPEAVQGSPNILDEGVFYKDLNAVLNKYQGTDDDYRVVDVVYTQGSFINRTWAGDPFNNESYNSTIVQLLDFTERNVPVNGPFQGGNIRQFNTARNSYLDVSKQEVRNINNEIPTPTFQIGSYLDENGSLNVGGPSTQPIDIIGSLLTGGGVGFDPNSGGPVADFDVKGSLTGRVLNSIGAIEDTKLGVLGGQYLMAAIGNNIAFNIQEETIGRVNTNIRSLLTGGDIIIPNYKITVGDGFLGSSADLLERMTGVKLPVSLLQTSIFASDSGWDTGNMSRANSMLENTGKGQILSLFENLNASTDQSIIGDKRNGYAPPLKAANNSDGGINSEDTPNSSASYLYNNELQGGYNFINNGPAQLGGEEGAKGDSSFNEELEDTIGKGLRKSNFSWSDEFNNKDAKTELSNDQASDITFTEKKGLLYKTQELFKTNRMKTLVSGHAVQSQEDSQIQNTQKGYMSKGSGVLSSEAINGAYTTPENTFCRTWTTFDRYDQVGDMVRHSGLDIKSRKGGGVDVKSSVLGDNGFVRIGPAKNEKIEKFMFSIENLAWDGNTTNLLDCEKGPGDLLSGKKGRIMWFPPYDMSFNETTSANYDRSNFIGRGEPIYTYNNTERTGTLSWKIIIDHPNYMNYMKGMSNDEIASFFAGCLESNEIRDIVLTDAEKDKQAVAEASPVKEIVDDKVDSVVFKVYFANDTTEVPTMYENKDEIGLGTTKGEGIVGLTTSVYNDNTDFGLNREPINIGSDVVDGFLGNDMIPVLKEYMLNECEYCKIEMLGYASTSGNVNKNKELSSKRADSIKNWFKTQVMPGDKLGDKRFSSITAGGETGVGCLVNAEDTRPCKEARYVKIKISYDSSLKEDEKDSSPKTSGNGEPSNGVSIPVSRFFTECDYFERLGPADNDGNGGSFIYDTIGEKVKHFHPAFHSITPEGFNSRLNFLQQCMRQGPTVNDNGNPNNLAFGAAPVCILRVGDFYHTKIIIETLTIDYEPLVWDLNPEGVGVQPMIANVNISFAFIGGSSLRGPINKLQNAVSFNFFANTELYDPRADRISVSGGIEEGKGPSSENVLPESDKVEGINKSNGTIVENEVTVAEDENNTEESSQSNFDDDLTALSMVEANIQVGVNVTVNIQKKDKGKELSQDYSIMNIKLQDSLSKNVFNLPTSSTLLKTDDGLIIEGANDISDIGLVVNKPYFVFVDLIGKEDGNKITVRKFSTWN